MMQIPKWLSANAKAYWRNHAKYLALRPEQKETFAVLCEVYADYRQAIQQGDKALAKNMLDQYVRLAKEFRLTPKSQPKDEPSEGDSLLD